MNSVDWGTTEHEEEAGFSKNSGGVPAEDTPERESEPAEGAQGLADEEPAPHDACAPAPARAMSRKHSRSRHQQGLESIAAFITGDRGGRRRRDKEPEQQRSLHMGGTAGAPSQPSQPDAHRPSRHTSRSCCAAASATQLICRSDGPAAAPATQLTRCSTAIAVAGTLQNPLQSLVPGKLRRRSQDPSHPLVQRLAQDESKQRAK
eukprot:6482658-Amphidinium_carterae.1